MKYAVTTLAFGKPYLEEAITQFTNIINRTTNGTFHISTDMPKIEQDVNINLVNLTESTHLIPGNSNTFFYNYKVLALKPFLKSDYDLIMYIDADWKINENFDDQVMDKVLTYMNARELDFLFERPGAIVDHKEDLDNSYSRLKIEEYNATDHTLWDDAHVVNEQILIFKNNWKFRFFVQRWEQFLWYSIKNEILNFAEGFEIGISALESKMDYDFHALPKLFKNCFQFQDVTGKTHYRW